MDDLQRRSARPQGSDREQLENEFRKQGIFAASALLCSGLPLLALLIYLEAWMIASATIVMLGSISLFALGRPRRNYKACLKLAREMGGRGEWEMTWNYGWRGKHINTLFRLVDDSGKARGGFTLPPERQDDALSGIRVQKEKTRMRETPTSHDA